MPRAARPIFSGLSGRTRTTAVRAPLLVSLIDSIIAEDGARRKSRRNVDSGGTAVL
jgi:hypothetical protein